MLAMIAAVLAAWGNDLVLHTAVGKRYDPNHKVGVSVVRQLYGVKNHQRATNNVVECPQLPGFLERKSKHTRKGCVSFLRDVSVNLRRLGLEAAWTLTRCQRILIIS